MYCKIFKKNFNFIKKDSGLRYHVKIIRRYFLVIRVAPFPLWIFNPQLRINQQKIYLNNILRESGAIEQYESDKDCSAFEILEMLKDNEIDRTYKGKDDTFLLMTGEK